MKYSAEIAQKLEEGVQKIFESGEYKKYLSCASKFHNYSANNVVLILSQKPEASLVAGYQTWKGLNRQVRKGEKAIKIMAPITRKTTVKEKDENGQDVEKETVYTTFRAVNVFDVSQTDGEELPTTDSVVKSLNGSVEDYVKFIERMTKVAGMPVTYEDIEGTANGFCNLGEKKIVIRKGMPEAQTVKTLVHEIAHSILHDKDNGTAKDASQGDREVQAESVAFIVCDYFGIDTSDYSFGYIATWSGSKTTKELLASMSVINKTANQIITAMEGGK